MKCAKVATYHITDIEQGQPHEYHFCDDHARHHLAPNSDNPDKPAMSELAKELINSAGEVLPGAMTADQLTCPVCQITFGEFRSTGRLGCPHDYEVFRDELMPLLENIHESTRHSGKAPNRAPRDPKQQTMLIQLRNDLKRAVAAEDYESAARVRDMIKSLEQELGR
jgi:protein arginine kinase activator